MEYTSNFLVYKIINTQDKNKKFYIGSTKNGIAGRYGKNPNLLKHHNKVVRRAVKKYGNSAFKIEIVQECFSKIEARTMEQWWLLYYKWNGFKLCKTMYNAAWVVNYNAGKDFGKKMKKIMNTKKMRKKISKNTKKALSKPDVKLKVIGENNHKAKLTNSNIIEIRKKWNDLENKKRGDMKIFCIEQAKIYFVCAKTINRIVVLYTWKHI